MLRLKIIKLTRKPSQAATYLSTHALNCAKLNNKSAKVFRKKIHLTGRHIQATEPKSTLAYEQKLQTCGHI